MKLEIKYELLRCRKQSREKKICLQLSAVLFRIHLNRHIDIVCVGLPHSRSGEQVQ